MLEIRLLGRFEVRQDGEILAIPSRPAQSLFAYLLLNPGISHRREKLAGLLAPGSSEENARSALRHALWRLRKALGSNPATGCDHLLADDLGIGLDPSAAYSLDVTTLTAPTGAAAEDLMASVSVYGGELLPGFYEDWVQLERGRLEATFEHKMRLLLDRLVEASRWDDVLEWGERWIAVGATPEAAYRALMVAHAAEGDSARAAAAYRRCVEALRSELGVEPAEATCELYGHLVKGEALPGLPRWNSLPVQIARPAFGCSAVSAQDDAPAPGDPPFKGLQCFDVADVNLFFGREALTARLVQRLREDPLLIVVGASGSGKSSLVRAGLIPALMQGAFGSHDGNHAEEDHRAWRYHLITPTSHPLLALALSLTRDSESVTAATTLADDMARDPRSLGLYLARMALSGNGRHGTHAFIVIDQFEELFTQCRSEPERAAFIANLMAVAPPGQTRGGPATLVLTLRADFYARCAEYPELRAALMASQEYIGALTRDELRRAIECPAEAGGWGFEPGLVDVLLHDAGSEPGALPLVSHALLETWQRRRGRMMTLSGYMAAGGVSGAIARSAETTYARLSPAQQAVARNIFLRLTELGEETQDTRRRAPISEFFSDPASRPTVEAVLAILADARLITVSAEQAEVAHEALIREWPLLREWLSQDREGLLVHRRLTEAAGSWAALDRDAGELYRGARLARALEWAGARQADLSELERAFLDASRAAAEREEAEREARRQRELEAALRLANEQRRSASRLRRAALFLAGALALAFVLGGLAYVLAGRAREQAQVAQNERTLALSRELAASAGSSVSVDSQLGMLLALEAANGPLRAGLTPPLEVEAALHRVLQVIQRRATIASEAGVAISPDGALAATAADDGTLRLWPAAQWTTTGEPVGEALHALPGKPGYHMLAFSPDHGLLADGAEDGSVTVWSTQTGAALPALTGHSGAITRLALSSDGSRLASLGADQMARVWETATGRELLKVGPIPAGIVAMDLAPDGSRLATGDESGAVALWDISTGEKSSVLAGPFAGIQEIRFCGRDLLGVRLPAALSLWNAVTGERAPGLEGLPSLAIGSFACDPAADRIAIAGMGSEVKILGISSGRELATLPDTPAVTDLNFSTDGLLLLVHTPLEAAEVWESYGGAELPIFAAPNGSGAVAISPDGAHVVAGLDMDGGLGLWAVPAAPGLAGEKVEAPATQIRTWPTLHDSRITALAFSPDGQQLATADGASEVKVSDVAVLLSPGADSAPARTLPKPPAWDNYAVLDLAFSPDGKRLAAVTPNVLPPYQPLGLWDLPASAAGGIPAVHQWQGDDFPQWTRSVTFSPDGIHIALGLRSGQVEVRDAADGALAYALGTHGFNVMDLTYTPDGRQLATVTREGTHNMWRLPEANAAVGSTGVELFTLRAHDTAISAVAITPAGDRVITGSQDGTVRVWDATTGRALMTLAEGPAPVTGLSLSADGRRLAVASDAIRIYALTMDDLRALAGARATRALTPEERLRYLHENAPLLSATQGPAPAAPIRPACPQHIVRAFVNSWNRMDSFAVASLFTPEFNYSLDTLWGRSELPLPSRKVLIGTALFATQGEGGRFVLVGCAPPAVDQTVQCQLTYSSSCLEALHEDPAHFTATFAFNGDKISKVVGEPDGVEHFKMELYQYYLWSIDHAPDLFGILHAMDQAPATDWADSVKAGKTWAAICQRYAASLGLK